MNNNDQAPKVTRVLIVEGTQLASHLLSDALGQYPWLDVVAATWSFSESLRKVTEEGPEVVILSAVLEDRSKCGFEISREIRSAAPEARVVMLLDDCRSEPVVEAFRTGAKGIFSRNESLAALAKCIACVAAGQIWMTHEHLGFLVEALSGSALRKHFNPDDFTALSKREKEVAYGVIDGLNNREIAKRLNVSSHTVKNHISRIFEKLGVSSRFELMAAMGRRRASTSSPGNLHWKAGPDHVQSSLLAAAEAGVASAQFVVGQMYLHGQGVTKDKILGYKWLLLAEKANQGFSEASRIMRKRLATEMLSAQITEAERLAAENGRVFEDPSWWVPAVGRAPNTRSTASEPSSIVGIS